MHFTLQRQYCSLSYFVGLCPTILQAHAVAAREASALCHKGHHDAFDAFRFTNLFMQGLVLEEIVVIFFTLSPIL